MYVIVENIFIKTMHVQFVRLHDRYSRQYQKPNPFLTCIQTYTPTSFNLAMRGHVDLRLCALCVLAPPQARDRLRLGIESETRLAVEGVCAATSNALLVAGEAEHGKWHWDGNIDTNLTGLNFALEAAGGGARSGEDGGTVAILVVVDEINGLVDSLDVQANQYRTEDLLAIAAHVWFDITDDRGANL